MIDPQLTAAQDRLEQLTADLVRATTARQEAMTAHVAAEEAWVDADRVCRRLADQVHAQRQNLDYLDQRASDAAG